MIFYHIWTYSEHMEQKYQQLLITVASGISDLTLKSQNIYRASISFTKNIKRTFQRPYEPINGN